MDSFGIRPAEAGRGFSAAGGEISAIRMAVRGPRHRKARSAPFLPYAGLPVKDSAGPGPLTGPSSPITGCFQENTLQGR